MIFPLPVSGRLMRADHGLYRQPDWIRSGRADMAVDVVKAASAAARGRLGYAEFD
jgi:hypothetical protein